MQTGNGLRAWISRFSRSITPQRPNRSDKTSKHFAAAARCGVEALEKRTLLSAVTITTDSGTNSIYIRAAGGNVQVFRNQPITAQPLYSFPVADGDPITISNGNGNDTVTVDYSGGDPIAGGLQFSAASTAAGNLSQLVIANLSAAHIQLNTGYVYVTDGSIQDAISYSQVPNLNLFGGGGSSQLNVASGGYTFNSDLGAGGAQVDVDVAANASISFGMTQHLHSLTIEANGTAAMLPVGGQVLDVGTLTVEGSLDLSDENLIVNDPGSNITLLQEQVAAGYQNPDPSLPGTIFSSSAVTDGMAVGVAPESEVLLGTLDGQTIPSTALVARYTYAGDANLDGYVNGTDLNILAPIYNTVTGYAPPHWDLGDFNFDGIVNGTDINLLAPNFNAYLAQPATVTLGTPYLLTLPALLSDRTPVARWDVDWGDGSFDSYTTGTSAAHIYTSIGPRLVQMTEITAAEAVVPMPALALAITSSTGLTAVNLTAGSAGDAFNIACDTAGHTLITETDATGADVSQYTYSTASLLSVTITGDTTGAATVDFTHGDPLPAPGLSIDSATLNITGSTGSDTLFTTATAAVFGAAEIRHPNTTAVTFLNAGPGDELFATAGTVTLAGDTSNSGQGSANGGPSVFVNTGATVLLTGTQHLSALNIAPGGTARMAQDGTDVLVTSSLNVSPADTAPGNLPASIGVAIGGNDSGSTTLTWRGGASAGYYGTLPGGADASGNRLNDVHVRLLPVGSVNPFTPAALGYSAGTFQPGQWTLVVRDNDHYNAWGGDNVYLEQGYVLTNGELSPVGGSFAVDDYEEAAVTAGESITLNSPLLPGTSSTANARPGGILDLSDNDLIVHGGNLSQIFGLLRVGYDGSKWDGEGTATPFSASIVSSAAAMAVVHAQTLGVGQIGQGVFLPQAGYFDNQPVSSGDVIVKYTYYGDADLDGTVGDSGDAAQLDNGNSNHLTGWTTGDFNYDGIVNASDYTLYDNWRNSEWVSGEQTIVAGVDFPTNSLPTLLPDDLTPIVKWRVNWDNGSTQTFVASDTVANPYSSADATYLASFDALDASGNVIYRYPHRNITVVPPSWIGATSGSTDDAAHDYDNSANWVGGIISDSLDGVVLTGNTTLYFDADYTTGSAGLSLNYLGAHDLTFLPNALTTRTLTLAGDLSGNFGGSANHQTVTFGSSGAPLNLSLGSNNRHIALSNGDTLLLDTTITSGTVNLYGNGTLCMGVNDALNGTPLNIYGGIFDINGTSQTVTNLSGNAGTIVNNDGGTSATLTDGGGTSAYSGTLADHVSATGGTLALALSDGALFTPEGYNTYSGGTTVNSGTLNIDGSSNSSVGTGAIVNNGTLQLSEDVAVSLANNIGGSGTIIQNGNGLVHYTGASSDSGNFIITAGFFAVEGSLNNSGEAISVSGTGVLAGTGSIAGSVTVAPGGSLDPGDGGDNIGTLSIGGNLILDSDSTLTCWIDGLSTGSYDQLDIAGTISIDGAMLELEELYGNTIIPERSALTLIRNDGTSAATGFFDHNLPYEVAGGWCQVNYTGGADTKNVTLSAYPPETLSDELVITATGSADSIEVSQSGSMLTIVDDGRTSTDPVPIAGLFVYARGGTDTITINSSVICRTTVETIDGTSDSITSAGTNVSVWMDSSDSFSGTGTVHSVVGFLGAVPKITGASLLNPSDIGSTLYDPDLPLWGTGPVVSDVNQGFVGDCYFMCSIAALANGKPSQLQESAVDMGDGTYTVQFWLDGAPVYVRVNGEMGGNYATNGEFVYTAAKPGPNGTMWALVMEKAFAYFRSYVPGTITQSPTSRNSYDSITAGFQEEVYPDLGLTYTDDDPSSNNNGFSPFETAAAFHSWISAALSNGEAVTVDTAAPPADLNLVNTHAYSVLSVTLDNGDWEYLVRNPWGHYPGPDGELSLTFAQMQVGFWDIVVEVN